MTIRSKFIHCKKRKVPIMHKKMHASTNTKIAMQILPHAQGCTCQGSCGAQCACKKQQKPGFIEKIERNAQSTLCCRG
jgi:hypothetical protein